MENVVVKVEIETVSPCRRRLKIEIPDQEMKQELEAVYQELSRTVKVPGFRQGKVPREIIVTRYAKEAQDELLNRVIPQAYSKAVKEQELHPVGRASINQVEYRENTPLKFQALLDIAPEFKLNNYKGISLRRKKVAVTDEDVTQALENLRQSHAQFQAVAERAIKMGDYAIADWEIFCEGKSAEKAKDRWLWVDGKHNVQEFDEQLVGARAGEKKEVKVTLPADYPKKELAGKEAVFHVVVKEIKERILPELNDDFAKELGKFETLSQVREEVKKQLERLKEKEEERGLRAQAAEYLLKEYRFAVPESLVETIAQEITARALHQMRQRGAKESDLNAQMENLKKTARERAVAEVRISYLVDAIAETETIAVGKEDMEKHLVELVRGGQNPAYLEQFYREKQHIEELKAQLLEEKVLQFLVSQGKIKIED